MLPSCRRCGHSDRLRMYALMTGWYGRAADVPPDHGYFYLCPACFAERIADIEPLILRRLSEEHPAWRALRQPPAP